MIGMGNTVPPFNRSFILIGSDGNIPHQAVMRSLALLGQEVIPALHEVALQPYA